MRGRMQCKIKIVLFDCFPRNEYCLELAMLKVHTQGQCSPSGSHEPKMSRLPTCEYCFDLACFSFTVSPTILPQQALHHGWKGAGTYVGGK